MNLIYKATVTSIKKKTEELFQTGGNEKYMSYKWTNITGFDPEHKKDIIQTRGKFHWVYVLKRSIGSMLTFLFW